MVQRRWRLLRLQWLRLLRLLRLRRLRRLLRLMRLLRLTWLRLTLISTLALGNSIPGCCSRRQIWRDELWRELWIHCLEPVRYARRHRRLRRHRGWLARRHVTRTTPRLCSDPGLAHFAASSRRLLLAVVVARAILALHPATLHGRRVRASGVLWSRNLTPRCVEGDEEPLHRERGSAGRTG